MSAALRIPAEKFVPLYAALGVTPDRFGMYWNEADEATRRLLLQIAKQPTFLSGDRWADLKAETRGAIKRRAADLRDWLVRSLP